MSTLAGFALGLVAGGLSGAWLVLLWVCESRAPLEPTSPRQTTWPEREIRA